MAAVPGTFPPVLARVARLEAPGLWALASQWSMLFCTHWMLWSSWKREGRPRLPSVCTKINTFCMSTCGLLKAQSPVSVLASTASLPPLPPVQAHQSTHRGKGILGEGGACTAVSVTQASSSDPQEATLEVAGKQTQVQGPPGTPTREGHAPGYAGRGIAPSLLSELALMWL